MKVFALGGYGAFGLVVAKVLGESEHVSGITLAGRNWDRAKQAAAKIGDKARAVQVDGTNEKQLSSLIADHDIIVNVAGKVDLPALHAAVHTGVHYCDVGQVRYSDAQMHGIAAEARDAGITAVICNGNAPGITNLMGVHAASQMEETEQLQGGLSLVVELPGTRVLTPQQWLENPKESLVVLQEFRPFLGMMLRFAQKKGVRTVRVFQDGHWVDEDPMVSGLKAPLPEGSTVTAHPHGSYDPILEELPHGLSTARPVQMWFSTFPPQLHDLFCKQTSRVAAGDVDPTTAMSSFYRAVANDPDRWLTVTESFVALPPQWVTAVGRKEGRAARFSCWLAPTAAWNQRNEGFIVSAPLAVAVFRILRGDIEQRGVMTAEAAFEPLSFFDEVVDLLPELPPDGKLIGESFEWLE